jgi:sec-independent protein translocase protein TatA
MGPIGFPELIIILVLALIVLGPKKLPDAGRSIGKGMREFKNAIGGESHDDDDGDVVALPPARDTAKEPAA